MLISLIAAVGRNRVIGRGNGLPWSLPADLKHFRKLTLGKPIVMGRRTFETLSGSLPRRTNVIITRRKDYRAPGCTVVHSLEDALIAGGRSEELMVCGGSEIYAAFLPQADRMYLTLIDADFEGDTLFPEYDPEQWTEIDRQDYDSDEENPYRYSFVTLERKRT